jgi:hypothetical protein
MLRRYQTTDARYVKGAEDEWWDTNGIGIVPEAVVDEYMRRNRVGVVVLGEGDEEPVDGLGTENLQAKHGPLH